MNNENEILKQNELSCRVENFIRKDGQQEIRLVGGTKEERQWARQLLPHIRFPEED